jgi:membrane protease YdiL (CAAX protease family)
VHTVASQVNTGVASRRHLAIVVALLLAVGTATFVNHQTRHGGALEFPAGQRLPIYLRVAALEWLLLAYVELGIHRHGRTVGSIIYSHPGGLPRWFSSIAFGLGATLLWMALGAAIMVALRPTTDELRIVQSFFPRGVSEKVGFVVLTLTAGFCEEFIYRGYLQQQFQALTGSLTLGIVLQAILFAVLHVTLPWKFVVSVTAMALFLGALVGWRTTLVPAMLVHTVVNLFGGLLSSAGATG